MGLYHFPPTSSSFLYLHSSDFWYLDELTCQLSRDVASGAAEVSFNSLSHVFSLPSLWNSVILVLMPSLAGILLSSITGKKFVIFLIFLSPGTAKVKLSFEFFSILSVIIILKVSVTFWSSFLFEPWRFCNLFVCSGTGQNVAIEKFIPKLTYIFKIFNKNKWNYWSLPVPMTMRFAAGSTIIHLSNAVTCCRCSVHCPLDYVAA